MFLAAIPLGVERLDLAIRRLLGGFGGVPLLIVLLLLVPAVRLSVEGARQQPVAESVDGLRDGIAALAGWVRMSGRIVTLSPPETIAAGRSIHSLLIEQSGDAIVLLSEGTLEELTNVTGHVAGSFRADETARRVGGPRMPDEDLDIIDDYVLRVDDEIVATDAGTAAFVWGPLLAAGVLIAGRLVGYPVLRHHHGAVAAGARPLGAGETVPVRVVERQEEIGPRLRSPRGEFRRLERRDPADPYFSLATEGRGRPLYFHRHRWSSARACTLWTVRERAPAVELRDWGIEVLLVVDDEADRDRVLASFSLDREADDGDGPDEPPA